MVNLLLVIIAWLVIGVVALLLRRLARVEKERDALLDRLLVANSIMPIVKDVVPAQIKEKTAPQRIKFKLFP